MAQYYRSAHSCPRGQHAANCIKERQNNVAANKAILLFSWKQHKLPMTTSHIWKRPCSAEITVQCLLPCQVAAVAADIDVLIALLSLATE